MGGAAAVIARAKADFAKGEYRWVAQVMKEVVYAEPDNIEARALCADALEQMGYQAESATWRNAFLYGAQELRHGVFQLPARIGMSADTLAGLTSDMFFDMMAIRLDPAKAAGQSTVVNWHFTDRDEKLVLTLSTAPSAIAWASGRTRRRPRSPRRAARSTPSCWARLTAPDALASGALQDRRRSFAPGRAVRHARSAGRPHVRHPHAG